MFHTSVSLAAGIPRIFGQGVEVGQMPSCYVEKKTEHLLEPLINRPPLYAGSQRLLVL